MKRYLACLLVGPLLCSAGMSQTPVASFGEASAKIEEELRDSVRELDELFQAIASEKIPLNTRLSTLQSELIAERGEYQATTRLLDSRTLDLSNLQGEIRTRREEIAYARNLLSEFMRNLESRLHVSELQRYGTELDTAAMATSNTSLSERDVLGAQLALVDTSITRLERALDGDRFPGRALDEEGVLREGDFMVFGPAAFFAAAEGDALGMAEQRLNSLEPAIVPFEDLMVVETVAAAFANGHGVLPFDTTLGNAQKMASTKETFLEHLEKGGAVMFPIVGMAALALIVALCKWLAILFQPIPSQKQIDGVREAVGRLDQEAALKRAGHLRGPLGKMLATGVKHMREPRELVEEVMYETVLTTRLRLNSALPFIAICAASAPLLGLLGTVTGIINTFKIITVFGSGDVKSLSGGISEALITTKFGLIVAIPALLIHAFLSRMAKSRIDRMEKAAVSFVNELAKSGSSKESGIDLDTRLLDGNEQGTGLVPSSANADALALRLLGEIDDLRKELRSGSGAQQASEA